MTYPDTIELSWTRNQILQNGNIETTFPNAGHFSPEGHFSLMSIMPGRAFLPGLKCPGGIFAWDEMPGEAKYWGNISAYYTGNFKIQTSERLRERKNRIEKQKEMTITVSKYIYNGMEVNTRGLKGSGPCTSTCQNLTELYVHVQSNHITSRSSSFRFRCVFTSRLHE